MVPSCMTATKIDAGVSTTNEGGRNGPCPHRAQGLMVEADRMQIFSKDQSGGVNTNKERKCRTQKAREPAPQGSFRVFSLEHM